MYETSIVDIFNARQHLKEQVDGSWSLEISWVAFLVGCQVFAFQVHHDKVLLSTFFLVDELVHLNDALVVN